MRLLTSWRALALFLALTGPVAGAAADLSRIDRNLSKEPAYQSGTPKYCLLVFGPEARTRVWLVLDGDALYLDRNGNGDLTEKGKRMLLQFDRRNDPNSPIEAFGECKDSTRQPDLARRAGPGADARYSELSVTWIIPRQGYVPSTERLKELYERIRTGLVRVGVVVEGKQEQVGEAALADRPQDAPILHFDGPLMFSTAKYCRTYHPKLVRGQESQFGASLVIPGWGREALTSLGHRAFPEDLHPVADIEFPCRNGPAITSRVVLSHRC